MKIPFTKMHGLGNDFIVIDAREISLVTLSGLPARMCDRRLGIGADQILLLEKSTVANFRMRIFNADGSEVEMCGNGIRCLAKYVWDRGISSKDILDIETLAGIIRPEKAGDMVKVDMGEPVFDPERIPVKINAESKEKRAESEKRTGSIMNSKLQAQNSKLVIDYPLQIADRQFKITCISMGNPHAVIVVDDVANFPVTYYGPMIETHPIFPRKINVEFIELISEKEIQMRVWERGSGETMACGTGASAAAVASNLKGLSGREVTVRLLGGDLMIAWLPDNHVYMTGPAVEVFEGVYNS